jgi:hypothetical protein
MNGDGSREHSYLGPEGSTGDGAAPARRPPGQGLLPSPHAAPPCARRSRDAPRQGLRLPPAAWTAPTNRSRACALHRPSEPRTEHRSSVVPLVGELQPRRPASWIFARRRYVGWGARHVGEVRVCSPASAGREPVMGRGGGRAASAR